MTAYPHSVYDPSPKSWRILGGKMLGGTRLMTLMLCLVIEKKWEGKNENKEKVYFLSYYLVE